MLTENEVRLALVAALLTACGSTTEAVDAGVAPLEEVSLDSIGGACATGCIGVDVCANPEPECPEGYCLFDGRGDQLEAYCTADCSDRACPDGYRCGDVPFEIARACVADPAVCGDDVLQRGEICDDGNTVSDDGCRGDCLATDVPLGEQRRVVTSYTVSGSYVPKGGGDTPFSATITVDAELNAAAVGCASVRDTASGIDGADGYRFRRFAAAGCDGGTEVEMSFSVPYVVGSFPADGGSFPHLCATLALPAPDDARLVFCSPSMSESMEVDSVTGVASSDEAPLGAEGSFEGTMAYLPDEGLGGCDGVFAFDSCPAEVPAVLEVDASFEVVNTD